MQFLIKILCWVTITIYYCTPLTFGQSIKECYDYITQNKTNYSYQSLVSKQSQIICQGYYKPSSPHFFKTHGFQSVSDCQLQRYEKTAWFINSTVFTPSWVDQWPQFQRQHIGFPIQASTIQMPSRVKGFQCNQNFQTQCNTNITKCKSANNRLVVTQPYMLFVLKTKCSIPKVQGYKTCILTGYPKKPKQDKRYSYQMFGEVIIGTDIKLNLLSQKQKEKDLKNCVPNIKKASNYQQTYESQTRLPDHMFRIN